MLASYTAEERAALPAAKKEGKAAAKSSIILDVKPWDDETGFLICNLSWLPLPIRYGRLGDCSARN